MIKLFEHNRIAYNAAVAMLASTGKAAIIHPTGTGKSFIGFKLCEDNPEKTVLWLSPSEYIFKTQLEALKKASGYVPENIEFFTYAKLMNLSDAEISELHPDYAVLDEFHRAGAEMWGQGVQKLLNAYCLISYITVKYGDFTYNDVKDELAEIERLQYKVSLYYTVETIEYTETVYEGDPPTPVEVVRYVDIYHLHIYLDNNDLDSIVISISLGIWVMLSGILSYIYMKNDDKRENKK